MEEVPAIQPIESGPGERVASWFVYQSPEIRLGYLRLPSAHRRWGRPNLATGTVPWEGSIVAFPRNAVRWGFRGRTYVIDAGTAVWLRAEESYRREIIDARGDASDFVLLSPRWTDEYAPFRRDASEPLQRVDSAACVRLRGLIRRLRSRPDDESSVEEAVHLLLEPFCRPPVRPSRLRARANLVDEARELLSSRANENLPVRELARELGVSGAHLVRAFRRDAGTTVHAYRESLRLRAALAALEGGATGLVGIALEHGFSSHAHFARRFKRAFGASPSEWRTVLKGPAGSPRKTFPREIG